MSFAEAGSNKPPETFAAVVEAHWTAVYRLLYSLAGNRHDSEDLAQETFLRALNRWDSFKQGTNLRAWLLRIATNAFLDLKRKAQIRKVSSLPEDLPDGTAPVNSPLELAEQGELIRVAMQELTELTRLVFHLRVTEELSFREIAGIAGTSEEAARWHMHQARQKLLKRLGDSMQ